MHTISTNRVVILIVLLIGLRTQTALSQGFDQGRRARNNLDIGMSFNVGKTEYTTDRGDDFQLDRRRFGLGATYGVGRGKFVEAGFQRVIRSEVVDAKEINGDGYQFGFGFGGEYSSSPDISFVPYLHFDYGSEEFKTSDDVSLDLNGQELNYEKETTLEFSAYEFTLGTIVEFHTTETFTPFMGFEIFPLSEGELKTKKRATGSSEGQTPDADEEETSRANRKIEFERDDILNLIFGARTNLTSGFWLGGRARLISETTFALEGGFKF